MSHPIPLGVPLAGPYPVTASGRYVKGLAILAQFETTLKDHSSSGASHGSPTATLGLHYSSASPSAHCSFPPLLSMGVDPKSTP